MPGILGPGPPRTLHSGETCAKQGVPTVWRVDVVLLRWPAEAARRAELQGVGVPRLLMLEDGVAAPVLEDELEDWIRVPAVEGDLRARLDSLRRRAEGRVTPLPDLDEDGVLRLGAGWVSLPPVEARLMAALLDRYGAVVSRDALARAGWPGGAPGRNALDVHMLRLRRRVGPLMLAIRTVRSRGYLLEAGAAAGAAATG